MKHSKLILLTSGIVILLASIALCLLTTPLGINPGSSNLTPAQKALEWEQHNGDRPLVIQYGPSFILFTIALVLLFRYRTVTRPKAAEGASQPGAVRAVICDRCHQALERYDMSRGVRTVGGSLPTIYSGVVCKKCGKIECMQCRKKENAPCTWCGGEVSPAFG